MLRRRCYSSLASRPSPWVVTVGLEIHAQLDTPSKLFSKANNRFGGTINQDLDDFDVALPGSQPQINSHAILLAVRAALAFTCKVNPASTFDRKHYFYPDQPAGYQITQNYNALARDGSISLFERDGLDQAEPIVVGISQLQLEQDTGKTMYFDDPPMSLVDLNRNGTPLIEIVTTPCIPSAKAAGVAVRKIQSVLRAVHASEANMEAGGMRCDVNVSVTTEHDRHLGPSRRVEIKNLASSRIVTDAVAVESRRQINILEAGGTVGKETRGYDIDKRETFLTRTKESAVDYRYMPEPDLPSVVITEEFLEQCLQDLPELPDALLDRLQSEPYNLALKDARVLLQDKSLLLYYEAVLQQVGLRGKSAKIVSNWIVHELLGRRRVMQEMGKESSEIGVQSMATIIQYVIESTITGASGKLVLQAIMEGDKRSVAQIVHEKGLAMSTDLGALQDVIAKILEDHPPQAAKLRGGDIKIKKWFVGQAMKQTKG